MADEDRMRGRPGPSGDVMDLARRAEQGGSRKEPMMKDIVTEVERRYELGHR